MWYILHKNIVNIVKLIHYLTFDVFDQRCLRHNCIIYEFQSVILSLIKLLIMLAIAEGKEYQQHRKQADKNVKLWWLWHHFTIAKNNHEMSSLPSESFWLGLGISRQLSGPRPSAVSRSGIPSLSSSSSQSSPIPSLSESSWELLGISGQLSRLSWCPSSSLSKQPYKFKWHQIWMLNGKVFIASG